jgi:hypothetical protein
MKFNSKALLVFAGFVATLLVAVNAREGNLDPRFALAGIVAILVVEVAMVGPSLLRRAPK